jgi:phosphoribosylformylglycinamidine synthase
MWAAKLPGEGALLYDACVAMCDLMGRLGIAVDGGKDSLSMTARLGSDVVKAPGLCSLRVKSDFSIKISRKFYRAW